MKLHWHSYLVFSLGNFVYEILTKASLRDEPTMVVDEDSGGAFKDLNNKVRDLYHGAHGEGRHGNGIL
jgi:hypothetical protein